MSIFKKSDKKKKLVFAKDRKQGTIAIIITALFVGNTIYMIVKYLHDQKQEAELMQKQKIEYSAENFAPRKLERFNSLPTADKAKTSK